MKRYVIRGILSRLFAFSGVLSGHEMYAHADRLCETIERYRIKHDIEAHEIATAG